jgi:hypothetical protein
LREAKRRSNPFFLLRYGLLRYARNDVEKLPLHRAAKIGQMPVNLPQRNK